MTTLDVDVSVLHPLWDAPDGRVFRDTSHSTVDRAGNGFRCLYDIYGASSPNYTGKVTEAPRRLPEAARQLPQRNINDFRQTAGDIFVWGRDIKYRKEVALGVAPQFFPREDLQRFARAK